MSICSRGCSYTIIVMSEGSQAVGSDAVLPEGPVGGVPQAKPLHIQRLEQAVRIEPYLNYVEKLLTASTP